MSLPSISVVVPCYNAAMFIGEALTSILEQAVDELEILVINDGSTDGTEAALAPFRESIRYYEIPNSGGPSRPRNVGLGQATGDLISFCDADDMMLPGKLATAAQVLRDHPDIDFLFTNFQRCDENGTVTDPDFLADYRGFRQYLQPVGDTALGRLSGTDTYRALLRSNFIGTSSVVCRAGVFTAAGTFDETMPNAEDIDLWRRIAREGFTFAFLDQVCHSYRFHTDSVSRGGSRMFPAGIEGLTRQLPHCSDPRDLRFVQKKINDLWLSYGDALRREGKLGEARTAYRTALNRKFSWAGLKGLCFSYFGR